jgi:hypothetical protein
MCIRVFPIRTQWSPDLSVATDRALLRSAERVYVTVEHSKIIVV